MCIVFNFPLLAEINPIIGIGVYWCLSDIFRRSVTRAKKACIINKNIVYPTNYLPVNTDTSEIYHVRKAVPIENRRHEWLYPQQGPAPGPPDGKTKANFHGRRHVPTLLLH